MTGRWQKQAPKRGHNEGVWFTQYTMGEWHGPMYTFMTSLSALAKPIRFWSVPIYQPPHLPGQPPTPRKRRKSR